MPSESLLLAVTSGLGVGIFAGIVSGVCYIVVTGYTAKKPRNPNGPDWHCNICGVHFRSIETLFESGRVVTCVKCCANICRARCSKLTKDLEHQKVGWMCQTCQHPESWFKGILRALQPSLHENTARHIKMEPARIDEMDEDLDKLKKNEKQQVRDFIERLVEAMLGHNIDSANVTRIYNDPKYDDLISRYHTDLSAILTDLGSALHISISNLPVLGQSPCSAHASLKLLIQRIIQEAIGLPTLEKNDAEIEMSNGDVVNRTYEDLLATAILNKVVESYQDELCASRPNSVSSKISNLPLCRNDKEYYFSTETLNTKWRNGTSTPGEIDAASVSSLEDWVRSDSSVGSTKYVDSISFKIQQRIDEVSSTDDEAKVKPIIQDPIDTEWQENWLMQKRPLGRNSSPVPVPMLVPNPSTVAKVLIGDREADDTTDLSDAGSDFGEAESSHSIEQILTSSKTVIGGKNLLGTEQLNENFSFELKEDSDHIEESTYDTCKEDNSCMSFESQTEQDTEYTEKYATLPRTILKSPTPNVENHKKNQEENVLPVNGYNTKHFDETDGHVSNGLPNQNGYHKETDVLLDECGDTEEIFEGNYSKREKEKWNNAVEMKNNPYSCENLKRRLSNRSVNSISSLFGSDYYTREAIKSAGITNNKLSSNEDLSDNNIILIEKSAIPAPNNEIYTAKPIFVEPDDVPEIDLSSLEITSPVPSSDSDHSVERIYNLPSGNVYVNEKSNKSSSADYKFTNGDHQTKTTSHVPLENTEQESIEKCMEFSLEFSTDESMQDTTNKEENQSTVTDPEITNLCDKHLVKDILGRFSKSYPNLSSQMKKDIECNDYEYEAPSTYKHDHGKQVYSLTARSIPKEFREELKKKEKAARSTSTSAILVEVQQSDEITPFPVAKSKIKFFESLKS